MEVLYYLLSSALRRLGVTLGGSWHGNDTAWRMVLDLHRILQYGDSSGALHRSRQRRHLVLVDGIVGGEGNGPLAPRPVDCGTLLFADEPALADRIAWRLMGYRPEVLPLLRVSRTMGRQGDAADGEPSIYCQRQAGGRRGVGAPVVTTVHRPQGMALLLVEPCSVRRNPAGTPEDRPRVMAHRRRTASTGARRFRLDAVVGGEAEDGLEYGSVETGLVAHTHPAGGYGVFWKSYLLEYTPTGELQEVFVTSLFRYRLHDSYEVSDEPRQAAGCSALSFGRVAGRSNRTVRLPNGRSLHSEAVSHIVRGVPGITGYQAISGKEGVTLNVTVSKTLAEADVRRIRGMAHRIDPGFGEFLKVREVPELERTIAGKTPVILVRDGSASTHEAVP